MNRITFFRIFVTLFVAFVTLSCSRKEARRPVTAKTNTFLKESAKKNKELISSQVRYIDSVTRLDTLHTYTSSADGFKYYYIKQNPEQTYVPQFGDKVQFTYGISDVLGNEIYPKDEEKITTYYVDKQELFLGLRMAIKRLKQGEEAVFFFPSEMAFGYVGDKDKIPSNMPIKLHLQIISVTPQENNE